MISNSIEYRRHKRQTPKANGGFTLIEVIVAMTLIIIMAAVATPSLREWHTKMTMRKDSRDVLLAIKFARTKAISLGQNVTFSINDATRTYTVKDSGGGSHAEGTIDDTITITNNNMGGSVQFDSKGMPSTSGSFQMENGLITKTITLYLTGMSKLI